MIQAITPTPDIPCRPGWCLAYVNEAFRVRKVYGTAIAAWNNSPTQHRDMNFPAGCWVPLWFSLETEPAGHVALLAPDGAVWSTTHPTAKTPTRHPNLADLFRAYARYNPLTYLGWTEDVEGTRVLAGIAAQSATITPLEDEDMAIDIDALVGRLDELNKKHHEATREHVNGKTGAILAREPFLIHRLDELNAAHHVATRVHVNGVRDGLLASIRTTIDLLAPNADAGAVAAAEAIYDQVAAKLAALEITVKVGE